jgi:hypothetical protein
VQQVEYIITSYPGEDGLVAEIWRDGQLVAAVSFDPSGRLRERRFTDDAPEPLLSEARARLLRYYPERESAAK